MSGADAGLDDTFPVTTLTGSFPALVVDDEGMVLVATEGSLSGAEVVRFWP